MKILISLGFCLLFLLPFTAFGQNQQLNPPPQQSVNLYGGTNLDNNPQALNNIADNNKFVIHEVVQSNNVNEEVFENQQISNKSKHNSAGPLTFGGGATSGNMKKNLSFRKTRHRFDKKMHRLFSKTPKKKRSNTSCFSWS